MRQSRNLTRDMKDIEDLYHSVLTEQFDHDVKHHDKEEKVELVKGTGPEASDGFHEPEVDVEKLSEKDEEENAFEPAKYSQNSRKVVEDSINNSTMSEENIFDKLYKTVMESEDALEEMGAQMSYEADDDPMDAASNDDGKVTVELEPHHVDALKDILAQLDGDEGDEEDPFDADMEDGEEPLPEAIEAHAAPAAKEEHGTSDNKVGSVKPKGGKAQSGAVKADGTLKAMAVKGADSPTGDNKVGHGEWG